MALIQQVFDYGRLFMKTALSTLTFDFRGYHHMTKGAMSYGRAPTKSEISLTCLAS